MTTWYVRPDTSHSGTRNGQSYDTAWGGWSAITWGGAGVVAGDTLYVCGAHSITSAIAIGNHGATVSNRVTISGGYELDPGSITASADGGVFLQVNRDYTTLTDLTITANTSFALYFFAAAPLAGVTIQKCAFHGGTGAPIINLSAANLQAWSDITIDDCDFIGGSGGTLGAAINWVVAKFGTPVSTLSRITIKNNRFTDCYADRAVVELRLEDECHADSKMADIVITDNTFRDCPTLALEIYGPSVYGINTGIRVTGNKFYDMTANSLPFNIGGAIGIGGFAPSLTSGFGSNVIARNEGYRLQGPTGLINLFYGTYRIFDNYGEDIVATQGDGNGILFDHGCDNCVAYGNKFRRLTGNSILEFTGVGIMVLDATNITVYGNIVDGCKIGVYLGNKAAAQSSNIYNNTFKDCWYAGYYALSTADMAANLIRNNIFTGQASVPSVLIKGGTMTGESGNCYHGFTNPVGHTLHASDITADPELDSNYRPAAAALTGTGLYLGGRDWTGKTFYNPPNIGAVDVLPLSPRYALKQQ